MLVRRSCVDRENGLGEVPRYYSAWFAAWTPSQLADQAMSRDYQIRPPLFRDSCGKSAEKFRERDTLIGPRRKNTWVHGFLFTWNSKRNLFSFRSISYIFKIVLVPIYLACLLQTDSKRVKFNMKKRFFWRKSLKPSVRNNSLSDSSCLRIYERYDLCIYETYFISY